MKRIGAFCAALLLVFLLCPAAAANGISDSLILSPEEQTLAAEQGTLTAIANPEEAPYLQIVDGTPVGIIPDMVAVLEQRTGLQIEIAPVSSYHEYVERIRNQDFDLILDVDPDLDNDGAAKFACTDPYLHVTCSRVSRKGESTAVSGVAVLPQYSLETTCADHYYYAEQLHYFNSQSECLQAVLSGECGAAILNSYAAEQLVNQSARSQFAAMTLSGENEPVCIALRDRDNLALLALLNRAIASIDSTTSSQIISHHTQYAKPKMTLLDYLYLYPVYVIGAVLILAAVLILTIVTLTERKQHRALQKYRMRLERFITHICEASSCVCELDCTAGKSCRYTVSDGKIQRDYRPYSTERFLEYVYPEDRALMTQALSNENLDRLISTVSHAYYECRLKTSAGEYEWTYCVLQGIQQDREHPRSFMLYIQNIQESRTVAEQQKQLLKNAVLTAENANAAKSGFLSRMSHEIRTPMNAIVGLTTIARHYENDPQKIDQYLGKIDSSSKVLLNIINDVLDMSAIESNKLKIARNPFNLHELLMALSNIYEPQCMQKGIGFEMRDSEVLHQSLIGDGLRINQILLNLISNAFKFTSEGKISVTVRETEKTSQTSYYQFEVSDTGAGMTEEMLGRLFRPFEQESADTARKHGGSGLGLSIARGLVEMMQGTISVTSEKGKGTTFTVSLPFEIHAAEPEKTVGVENLKVLIVDDDLDTRSYLSEMLRRFHICFETASGGQAAIATLEEVKTSGGSFDVCLLDWKMPGTDGLEVTRKIRELFGGEMAVVVVSAFDLSLIQKEAQGAGADYFLEKPLLPSMLFNLLGELTGTCRRGNPVKEEHYDFSGMRILLAEDNELNSEIALELLHMVHAEVDLAINGREAVQKFEASHPGTYDVILMDVQMPEMDGMTAARTIRSGSHPDAGTIPIYAMTANAFAEDVAAALNAGMNGHLAKPIDTAALYQTLARVFHGRHRESARPSEGGDEPERNG